MFLLQCWSYCFHCGYVCTTRAGLAEALGSRLETLLANTDEVNRLHLCADNIEKLRPLFLIDSNETENQSENIVQYNVKRMFAHHTFPKASLNWIGGSLFASLKVMEMHIHFVYERLCCIILIIICIVYVVTNRLIKPVDMSSVRNICCKYVVFK